MKILFNGCSYCYGAELQNPHITRYSKLISERFNSDDVNISANGSSNQKIFYDCYKHIQVESFDACVISITFLERFMLPYNDKFLQINPSSFKSTIYDKLSKMIYSISDYKTWYEYHSFYISMFSEYCNYKNIKYIYHFVSEKDRDIFFNEFPHKDSLIYKTFNQICKENGLAKGPGHHPLEDGHRIYADYLISEIHNKI